MFETESDAFTIQFSDHLQGVGTMSKIQWMSIRKEMETIKPWGVLIGTKDLDVNKPIAEGTECQLVRAEMEGTPLYLNSGCLSSWKNG